LITDFSDSKSNTDRSGNSSSVSNLSPELLTRLNFNSSNINNNSASVSNQVIKFNKDSLFTDNSAKVTSTTNDDDFNTNNSNKKIINLKRKSTHDTQELKKPLEYMGLLKNDANQASSSASKSDSLSLNERIKIINQKDEVEKSPVKKLVTINQSPLIKIVKLVKNEKFKSDIEQSSAKSSVFNRIKKINVNSEAIPVEELKSDTNSKIISLKKSKSIQERLSFK
jgi:hypothetical protein